VQNNLLTELNSRLVIPLTPNSEVDKKVAAKLCLVIPVAGSDFVLVTNEMTSVPKSNLKFAVE